MATVIDQLIRNIRNICPEFKVVGGASQYESVIQNAFNRDDSSLTQHPAAYVINLGKSAEPNLMANSMQQFETQTYGVVIVADNRSDRRGQTAITSIDELEESIMRAVYNFRPDYTKYVKGFQKVASSIVHSNRSELFWMCSFSIQTQYGYADGYQLEYAELTEVDFTDTTRGLVDEITIPQD